MAETAAGEEVPSIIRGSRREEVVGGQWLVVSMDAVESSAIPTSHRLLATSLLLRRQRRQSVRQFVQPLERGLPFLVAPLEFVAAYAIARLDDARG
jgi:hypothetical protein